jgi:hypothetical protein
MKVMLATRCRGASRAIYNADVKWPYRPREGYPSVPLWLFVVICSVTILFAIVFFGLIGEDPDKYGPAP